MTVSCIKNAVKETKIPGSFEKEINHSKEEEEHIKRYRCLRKFLVFCNLRIGLGRMKIR